MNDEEQVRRAERAKRIVDDPLWTEAWAIYRNRLMDVIDKADSANVELVMHAKRLLAASKAAQQHMTTILQDGAISAATIEMQKQQKKSRTN